MSNLIYLGVAAAITAIGCTILLMRQRKPTGVDNGIDAFRRELQALAPDRDTDAPRDNQGGHPG